MAHAELDAISVAKATKAAIGELQNVPDGGTSRDSNTLKRINDLAVAASIRHDRNVITVSIDEFALFSVEWNKAADRAKKE